MYQTRENHDKLLRRCVPNSRKSWKITGTLHFALGEKLLENYWKITGNYWELLEITGNYWKLLDNYWEITETFAFRPRRKITGTLQFRPWRKSREITGPLCTKLAKFLENYWGQNVVYQTRENHGKLLSNFFLGGGSFPENYWDPPRPP